MKKIKKIFNNKIMIFLLLVLLIIPLTFSRYIYDFVKNHLLESQGFYFYSSILTSTGSSFNIENWDGVNSYPITIDVTNRKNDQLYTKEDITYDIDVKCPNTVTCELNKSSGIIYSDNMQDTYEIIVTPIERINSGESVTIETSVTSTEPYEKTLKGQFVIGVTNEDFTYNIVDAVGEKYMVLELTNSVSYYKVATAFSGYSVGDIISRDDYNMLSKAEKANCYSADVVLSFDPNDILLDMTDATYKNKKRESLTTLNGFNYVNEYEFYMEANSYKKIIFYKNNISNNYTFPIVNSSSKVGVNVSLAN